MARLVTAPSLAATLDRLRDDLPQSLLLHGDVGVGLSTIASDIAPKAMTIEPLTKKGEVDHATGSISVERIRELYEQTRSQGAISQVVIDDAERMTLPAQNAFLKLLEEPPRGVHFILTSHSPDKLLATIRSRVESVHVPRVSQRASEQLLSANNLSQTARAQALFLASGRPALLRRLAEQPKLLEAAAQRTTDAKILLSAASRYDRARVALRYSSKTDALSLIDSALLVGKYGLMTAPSDTIAQRTESLLEAYRRISANASPRLQLMRFVLQ